MPRADASLPPIPLTPAQVETFALAHAACQWAREHIRPLSPDVQQRVHDDTTYAREVLHDAAVRGDIAAAAASAAAYADAWHTAIVRRSADTQK